MDVVIRGFEKHDLPGMTAVWNAIVQEGIAFPQIECLTGTTAMDFFAAQTFTGVALENGAVVGLYILHPKRENQGQACTV